MAAIDVIDSYVTALPGEHRRLAHTEWGLTLPAESAGGYPLDLGLSVRDGLLRVKAAATGPADDLDPWMLLWWNRQTRLVRFGCSRAREVWVHGEMPVAGLDETAVDRLLGLVAEGALNVRDYVRRVREAPATG